MISLQKTKCAYLLLMAYVFVTFVTLLSIFNVRKPLYGHIKEYLVGTNIKDIQRHEFILKDSSLHLKPAMGNKSRYTVLLYSAVAGNSSYKSQWDILSVTGWTIKGQEMQVNKCCVSFPSGLMKTFPVLSQNVLCTRCKLPVVQYICAINETEGGRQGGDMPVSMSVIHEGEACGRQNSTYVDIVYPYRQSGKIALFGKIAFGNISALNLIVWLEIHKLYGYDKVLLYTNGLNKDAEKVTDYYSKKGMLEKVPFYLPGPEHGVKRTPLGTKNAQGYADERVAYNDAHERLRGYTYLISIDTDEYLIPARHITFKELFTDLWKDKPHAAGFILRTYFYRKGLEFANTDSPFDVCRYLNRTSVLLERPKHVTMPDRVLYNGLKPHGAHPKEGFNKFIMSEKDGALRHYRTCKPNDRGSKFSCYINRTMDYTMPDVFKRIEKDVFHIAQSLGLITDLN